MKSKYRKLVTSIPHPQDLIDHAALAKLEPRSMLGQSEVFWDHAEGASVYDRHGNQWIDFSSGVLVANVGHSHPRVINKIKEQLDAGLAYAYCFPTEPRQNLARYFQRYLPENYKSFFLSTGSEATENVIKLIKTWGKKFSPKKNVIITFENGFHGRTMGSQLAGGIPALKGWVGEQAKLDDTFRCVPFPSEATPSYTLDDFCHYLDNMQISLEQIAGVFMETYQGGTAEFAAKDFICDLRTWTKDHNILLAFDEVQSGIGRTGKMFAFEHYDVFPDLFALGKGLSGILPVAATVGRADILDMYKPGEMTSTWGAHVLGCVATLENLAVLEDEGLVYRAEKLGIMLHEKLRSFSQRFSMIASISGKGLVAGIKIIHPETKLPNNKLAAKWVDLCIANGVMLFAPVGPGGGTVKLCPPLCIAEEALLEGLNVMYAAMEAMEHEMLPIHS